MKQYLFILPALILLASCGSETYNCVCTDTGDNNKHIADYKLEGKKESAAFECKQKNLQWVGPQYKKVECEIK